MEVDLRSGCRAVWCSPPRAPLHWHHVRCTSTSTLRPHHRLLMPTILRRYKTPKPSPEWPARRWSGVASRHRFEASVRHAPPPCASHCTGIMSRYQHAKAAPSVADDDHLTSLQDSETVARRVCQALVGRGKIGRASGRERVCSWV